MYKLCLELFWARKANITKPAISPSEGHTAFFSAILGDLMGFANITHRSAGGKPQGIYWFNFYVYWGDKGKLGEAVMFEGLIYHFNTGQCSVES